MGNNSTIIFSWHRNEYVSDEISQVHTDPAVWKRPDAFDPENFLENGKVINLDRLVQFSIGMESPRYSR